MLRLLILRGLPGSGKSTFAKELVNQKETGWVRTNKDDIRQMMFNGEWSRSKEKLVIEVEDSIIVSSLKRGINVVSDNTHLVDKHIERFKKLLKDNNLNKVSLEINDDFLKVPPEKCIERDLKRPNSVGSDIIWKLYWEHVVNKPIIEDNGKEKAIIVDIDGTLAKMVDRHPYEWDKVGQDVVRQHVKRTVDLYRASGHKIIILSGRNACCLDLTEQWLSDNNIEYDLLLLRNEGDNRKDYIVKSEFYDEHIKDHFYIDLVIDDRPQVIREWVRKGLPVLSANDTNREF